MGLFGDLLSAPFKIVSDVTGAVGEVTGTKRLTNIVSKPSEALGKSLEEIDD
jgi:hypothetical protein